VEEQVDGDHEPAHGVETGRGLRDTTEDTDGKEAASLEDNARDVDVTTTDARECDPGAACVSLDSLRRGLDTYMATPMMDIAERTRFMLKAPATDMPASSSLGHVVSGRQMQSGLRCHLHFHRQTSDDVAVPELDHPHAHHLNDRRQPLHIQRPSAPCITPLTISVRLRFTPMNISFQLPLAASIFSSASVWRMKATKPAASRSA
jgi:hypothetical protein